MRNHFVVSVVPRNIPGRGAVVAIAPALVAACGGGGSGNGGGSASLDGKLERLIADNDLHGHPTLDQAPLTPEQAALLEKRIELGRMLFFDHALSGVEQTSCGTWWR